MFDSQTMDIGPFLWLGNPPGQPAPSFGDRVARHSKGDQYGTKAERPNLRVVLGDSVIVRGHPSICTAALAVERPHPRVACRLTERNRRLVSTYA
jgi:hypothetical protein